MKSILLYVALLLAFVSAPVSAQNATTLSDILEQAAYQQDTANDPERAIKLYRQVIESEKATRKMAAQALYNIGLCYAKLKRNSEADQSFGAVVSQYKDVEPYYALADARLNPKFTPAAPHWQDGERLEYEVRGVNADKVANYYWITTTKTNWNGRSVWKMLNRSLGNNGLSLVIADEKTLRPLYGRADNPALGHATATWTDNSVKINKDNQERTTDFKGVVYDAEEQFWLLRQIPMSVGTKIKSQLLSTLATATPVPFVINVAGEEQVEVPAGKFDAYKLTDETGLGTIWIDKSPERYLLKVSGPGSSFQLKRITKVTPNTWRAIASSTSSFGMSIPDEWFNSGKIGERKYSGTKKVNGETVGSQITVPREEIGILDDDTKVKARVEIVDTKPLRELEDVDLSLKGRVSDLTLQLQKNLSNYAVREGSTVDRVITSSPALSFVADYQEGNAAWVIYSTCIKRDTTFVWIAFLTPKDNFNEAKPVFDGILKTATF